LHWFSASLPIELLLWTLANSWIYRSEDFFRTRHTQLCFAFSNTGLVALSSLEHLRIKRVEWSSSVSIFLSHMLWMMTKACRVFESAQVHSNDIYTPAQYKVLHIFRRCNLCLDFGWCPICRSERSSWTCQNRHRESLFHIYILLHIVVVLWTGSKGRTFSSDLSDARPRSALPSGSCYVETRSLMENSGVNSTSYISMLGFFLFLWWSNTVAISMPFLQLWDYRCIFWERLIQVLVLLSSSSRIPVLMTYHTGANFSLETTWWLSICHIPYRL
jgi:hypothetical protein